MKRLEAGTDLDGFRIGACIHAGGMAHIYKVTYADERPAPFDMVMKVPRMRAGDGAENIVGFEVEHQILQVLQGTHARHLHHHVKRCGALVSVGHFINVGHAASVNAGANAKAV